MKKSLLFGLIIGATAVLGASIYAFNGGQDPKAPDTTVTQAQAPEAGDLKWYTWEEAMEAMKTSKKKVIVDVYTDWCGWCKVMDKKTFSDPKVAEYLKKNFYPVKLDAEGKKDIIHDGHTFKYMANVGRGGVHELAASLLDNQLGYPSVVYLDENMARITISPGFKEAPDFLQELTFISEGHYKTKTFEAWKQGSGK